MYIEDRLFSENTEETLYSVLLDEDEYALYSEFQKEFGIAELAKKGFESFKKSGLKETAKKAYGVVKRAAKNYFEKVKGKLPKPVEIPKFEIPKFSVGIK
jgi:hypothetical protein